MDKWSETFSAGPNKVVVTYCVTTQTALAEKYHGTDLVEVTADPDRIKQWASELT